MPATAPSPSPLPSPPDFDDENDDDDDDWVVVEGREYMQSKREAAMAVQRVARGRKARRAVRTKSTTTPSSSSSQRGSTWQPPSEEAAATSVQRMARGRKARRNVPSQREGSLKPKRMKIIEEVAAEEEDVYDETALMMREIRALQEAASGYGELLREVKEGAQNERAATAMQSAARGRARLNVSGGGPSVAARRRQEVEVARTEVGEGGGSGVGGLVEGEEGMVEGRGRRVWWRRGGGYADQRMVEAEVELQLSMERYMNTLPAGGGGGSNLPAGGSSHTLSPSSAHQVQSSVVVGGERGEHYDEVMELSEEEEEEGGETPVRVQWRIEEAEEEEEEVVPDDAWEAEKEEEEEVYDEAAAMIREIEALQAIASGYGELLREVKEGAQNERAATAMQSAARGRKARRTLSPVPSSQQPQAMEVEEEAAMMLREIEALQEAASGYGELLREVKEGAQNERAATRVQSLIRGRNARLEAEVRERAHRITIPSSPFASFPLPFPFSHTQPFPSLFLPLFRSRPSFSGRWPATQACYHPRSPSS